MKFKVAQRSRHAKMLLIVALAVLLTTPGCVRGHRALKVSHARHNAAVQSRINEELLLNLVRLRYRDTPMFMQIGSVVAQFQFRATAGAGVTAREASTGSLDADAGVGFTEQPTFTFTPLQDNAFVQRMLTPMEPGVVVLLQRSGWSIDRVMRLVVQQFGGLDNATSASGPTPKRAPDYREFATVSRTLRELQASGALALGYEPGRTELSAPMPRDSVSGADAIEAAREGYRFELTPDGTAYLLTGSSRSLVLKIHDLEAHAQQAARLKSTLGLDSAQNRFELVAAQASHSALLGEAGARSTIPFATRSLLGTLFYLSQGIELPAQHLHDGLVTRTVDADGELFDWSDVTGDLLRVKVSPSDPGGAAVKVPYRGHWFYIEDTDLESKSTFTLLTELFSLQSGEAVGNAPVLTLPVGS